MEAFFRAFTPRPKPPPDTYSYFSAPDGEDVPRKMRHMVKNTGQLGLFLSTYESICYLNRRPVTYPALAGRFAYIICPIIGAGCIFTWTSNTLGRIKKDLMTVEEAKKRNVYDVAASSAWNWALGAAVASCAAFAWTRSLEYVLLTATSAGLMAAGIRYADVVGYKILYFEEPIGAYSVRIRDYTLTAERERNWTTGVAPPSTSSDGHQKTVVAGGNGKCEENDKK